MKRIAIVEDNPDNRLLVEALLEDAYATTAYATGVEALRGLRADPPDLVLLDISLPEMDGVAVLGALREDARLRALPVIALTAHAMRGDREHFLALGFDGYVQKPIVEEAHLLDSIREQLASSS